eukprot:scaffold296654_cov19-Tisochrysis_lutea.AAC.1
MSLPGGPLRMSRPGRAKAYIKMLGVWLQMSRGRTGYDADRKCWIATANEWVAQNRTSIKMGVKMRMLPAQSPAGTTE